MTTRRCTTNEILATVLRADSAETKTKASCFGELERLCAEARRAVDTQPELTAADKEWLLDELTSAIMADEWDLIEQGRRWAA